MFKKLLIAAAMLGMSASAYAIPSLQIGNGSGEWVWDSATETWMTSDASGATLELTSLTSVTAYLSVAAVPAQGLGGADAFNISFVSGPSMTFHDSGWGAPPFDDTSNVPGDLPSHGVFPTYWETYVFTFSTVGTVCNVQPGSLTDCTATNAGFVEMLGFTVNSMIEGVTGLHFDLYTVNSSGNVADKAPFSHDAGYIVPEPATLALFGLGLIGFGMARRRKN